MGSCFSEASLGLEIWIPRQIFGTRKGEYAIHMQGMKFPIEAVWIDGTKTIRLIYQNIQPNSGVTYPSLFRRMYCLELKAGFCKKYNVKIGSKVVFGLSDGWIESHIKQTTQSSTVCQLLVWFHYVPKDSWEVL